MKMIDLSKNTNPYYPSRKIKKDLYDSIRHVNSYPAASSSKYEELLGKHFGLKGDNVLLTQGTLGGFDILLKYLKPKKAGFLTPTFWGMQALAKKHGCTLIKENIDKGYCSEQINDLAKKVNLLYLCNPNNPTLTCLNKKKLLKLVSKNPNCHFVIDETLLSFSTSYKEESLCKEVTNYENLSVIISFSKIFSIAGLRISPLFSSSKLLKKVKNDSLMYSSIIINEYIINDLGKEYFSIDRSVFQDNLNRFCNDLNKKYIERIIDNKASFVLIKFIDKINTDNLVQYLESHGIKISNISKVYLELEKNYVRVSVGKKKDLRKLSKLINAYLEKQYE